MPGRCWRGWRSRAGRWPRIWLGAVTGLERRAVRRGLRELAAARLLAEDTSGGGHRPRHVLLAEAVAGGLLPGERAVLHERTARALEAAGGGRRWPRRRPGTGRPRAARPRSCRPGSRPPRPPSGCSVTRRRPGTGSGRSSYARHCLVPLGRPGSACRRLYVRAIDALHLSGDGVRAGESPRRPTAGSPVTVTLPSRRSSAIAPPISGRSRRRLPGCR